MYKYYSIYFLICQGFSWGLLCPQDFPQDFADVEYRRVVCVSQMPALADLCVVIEQNGGFIILPVQFFANGIGFGSAVLDSVKIGVGNVEKVEPNLLCLTHHFIVFLGAFLAEPSDDFHLNAILNGGIQQVSQFGGVYHRLSEDVGGGVIVAEHFKPVLYSVEVGNSAVHIKADFLDSGGIASKFGKHTDFFKVVHRSYLLSFCTIIIAPIVGKVKPSSCTKMWAKNLPNLFILLEPRVTLEHARIKNEGKYPSFLHFYFVLHCDVLAIFLDLLDEPAGGVALVDGGHLGKLRNPQSNNSVFLLVENHNYTSIGNRPPVATTLFINAVNGLNNLTNADGGHNEAGSVKSVLADVVTDISLNSHNFLFPFFSLGISIISYLGVVVNP